MKYDIPSQRRWEDPPQRIGEPDLGILPSGILRLIDTLVGSPNSRRRGTILHASAELPSGRERLKTGRTKRVLGCIARVSCAYFRS